MMPNISFSVSDEELSPYFNQIGIVPSSYFAELGKVFDGKRDFKIITALGAGYSSVYGEVSGYPTEDSEFYYYEQIAPVPFAYGKLGVEYPVVKELGRKSKLLLGASATVSMRPEAAFTTMGQISLNNIPERSFRMESGLLGTKFGLGVMPELKYLRALGKRWEIVGALGYQFAPMTMDRGKIEVLDNRSGQSDLFTDFERNLSHLSLSFEIRFH